MDNQTETALNDLIPDGGIEFTGDVWRSLRRPCVYVMSSDAEVLYVGMSSNGIERPFSPTHHALDYDRELAVDTIKVYPCHNMAAARRVERMLIVGLNPKWNKRQTVESIVLSNRRLA